MTELVDRRVRIMRSTVWDAIQIAAGELAPYNGGQVVELGSCALQRFRLEGKNFLPIANDTERQDVTTHFVGLMVAPELCGINVLQFGYGEQGAGDKDRKLINPPIGNPPVRLV